MCSNKWPRVRSKAPKRSCDRTHIESAIQTGERWERSMQASLRVLLVCALLCAVSGLLLQSCGYDACADVPVLTSMSPSSTAAGESGFQLTLTGRHFHSDTIFFWAGGEWASTTINSSTITSDIDAAKIASPGTVEVWVSGIPGGTNLSGPCGGGPSDKLTFTIH